MTESVWLYVNVPNGIVKVFGSYDTANEWLCQNDPYGVAVEYPVEEKAGSIVPKRTDVQVLLGAFLDARAILSDYLVPNSPRDANAMVEKLMDVLISDHVLAALSRIEKRRRFGLVEIEHTN